MKVWSRLVAVGQEVDVMERQLQLRIGSERQAESEKTSKNQREQRESGIKCIKAV